jgi:hypothetical protein
VSAQPLPHCSPQAALDPVAGDGLAKAFAYHKAIAIVVSPVWEATEHEVLCRPCFTTIPHSPEIFGVAQAESSRKHVSPLQKVQSLGIPISLFDVPRLGGQRLPTFSASRFDHSPARARFHAPPKTVHTRPAALLGLVCAFWHKLFLNIIFSAPNERGGVNCLSNDGRIIA